MHFSHLFDIVILGSVLKAFHYILPYRRSDYAVQEIFQFASFSNISKLFPDSFYEDFR